MGLKVVLVEIDFWTESSSSSSCMFLPMPRAHLIKNLDDRSENEIKISKALSKMSWQVLIPNNMRI